MWYNYNLEKLKEKTLEFPGFGLKMLG